MEYWVYALSGVRLDGDLIGEVDERGEAIVGDTMLLLLNAHYGHSLHAAGAWRGGTMGTSAPAALPGHASGVHRWAAVRASGPCHGRPEIKAQHEEAL